MEQNTMSESQRHRNRSMKTSDTGIIKHKYKKTQKLCLLVSTK